MDDVAGRYSDYQDRQDKLNRQPDEVARDVVAEFLIGEWDRAYMSSMPVEEWTPTMFNQDAEKLISTLAEHGLEITVVRKEVK